MDKFGCRYCWMTFDNIEPHWTCKCKVREKNKYKYHNLGLCKDCVTSWMMNTGNERGMYAQYRSCNNCDETVPFKILEELMPKNQYKMFQKQLMLFYSMKQKDIIYCPGIDCDMFYWKDPSLPKECIEANCIECDTDFCCWCSETITKDHNNMGCELYKQFIKKDHELIEIQKNTYKTFAKCSTCNTLIERSGGCREMHCHACNSLFTWPYKISDDESSSE